MGSESGAVKQLKALADELDKLNDRLERENERLRQAIILLTNAVDVILPYVVTDPAVIEHARRANQAARETVTGA